MTQLEFKDILISTGIDTYHNLAQDDEGNYIVWNLVGFKYSFGDNCIAERVAVYSVNYYTKLEYDENFLLIESVLERDDVTFDAPEVIYDWQTNITLYAYTVEAEFNYGYNQDGTVN